MAADSVFQAQYVYEAQQEDELNMQAGDKVRVLNNDNDSWWTVENVETGKKGLVPSNFLQPVSSPNGSSNKKNEGPVLAKVISEYEPQNSDELALWVNGIVTVLDQSTADGWWKGDLNGKVGVFPASHVKLVDAAEELESSDTAADAKPGKNSFKLAAYGVKQGGIGSILAGGMSLRKKGGPGRTSIAEEEHAPSPPPPTATGQPQQVQPTASTDKPNSPSAHKKGMVLHDYEPENKDELKLMRGEYVTITDKMDDQGWWAGINEAGASGVFPSNFVQVLEEQRPPPRRARPPTIKTDTPSSSQPSENPISPTSMARPPPVPVATRPTTLLSNRSSESSSSQSNNNPAPPPARPVTSPPLPTRRPPSAAAEPPKRTHKPRTPSIPLVSPDLPPITSKSYEHPTAAHEPAAPARPSRPVPTPGDGVTSPRASTVERRSVEVDHNRPPIPMAKPPKMFGAKQPSGPVPPPRTSSAGSRPASQAAAPPAVPIASPRELSLPGEPTSLKGSTGGNSDAPMSPPPMPRRSMPMPPPSSTQQSPIDGDIDDSAVDPNISKLLHREIEKIRSEFESLLQIERAERNRLEQEIRELKERRS